MKIFVQRSDEYVRQQTIALGENAPKTVVKDVAPSSLNEASRRLIVDVYGEYPASLCPRFSLKDGKYVVSNEVGYSKFSGPVEFAADADIDGVTPELVDKLLADAVVEAERRTAKYAEYLSELRQTQDAAIAAFLAADPRSSAAGGGPGDTLHSVRLLTADGVGGIDIGADHPRWKELVDAITHDKEEAARVRKAEVDADLQRQREEEKRKEEELAAWVAEFGTESQKARLARKMLPQSEILAARRDQVFAPLAPMPRYAKITLSEVLDSYAAAGHEFFDGGTLSCTVEDITEASAEMFQVLLNIEEALPSAVVKLRRHRCVLEESSREQDQESEVVRTSALVTVTVGSYTFSREYAV